jgi:hypothetical protein
MDKFYKPGLGAQPSPHDYRHLQHDQVGAPQTKAIGGTRYPTDKILHQRKVGICTAISLVQNVYVATGVRYSEDFQYLLQELYIDRDWLEGSSGYASLRVASKSKTGPQYGMLPIEHFPSIIDANPDITYEDYKNKLITIAGNRTEMERLLALCESPIKGYAQVNVASDHLIAQAIDDSKAGILARFDVYDTWWTAVDGRVSWLAKDLEPLRKGIRALSGHLVSITNYDFTNPFNHKAQQANTWGPTWADDGSAWFELNNYRPTEAWSIYYDFTPDYVPLPKASEWSHTFVKHMKLGDVTDEVKQLQIKLMIDGFMGRITKEEWGIYGPKTQKAVLALQLARKVPLSYYERYVLRGSKIGEKSLRALNLK